MQVHGRARGYTDKFLVTGPRLDTSDKEQDGTYERECCPLPVLIPRPDLLAVIEQIYTLYSELVAGKRLYCRWEGTDIR